MSSINQRRCFGSAWICAAALCVFGGTAARAANYTWNGSDGTRWHTPANWTPNGVPDGNTDNVLFVAVPSSSYSVTYLSHITTRSLEVRAGTVTLADSDGFLTYTLDAGGIFATAVIGSTTGPLTQLKVQGYAGASTSSIDANGPLFVALPAGSNAKLEIWHFFWDNTSYVQIGIGGAGELELRERGRLSCTGALLGTDSAATGTATVGGLSSSWTNTGLLKIGNFGTGTLTINAPGSVSNDGDGSIAHFGGSIGTVLVTGPGAEWQNNASLYVGGHAGAAGGTATLTVEADGVTTVVGDLMLYVGNTVNLDGGVINAGSLSGAEGVLNWIAGTLHITGAGLLIDPNEPLGDNRQIGAGQTLSVDGVLNVGVNAGATFTVAEGVGVTSGSALIGSVNGGSALSTARVTGSGSTWTMSGDLGMRSVNGADLIVENGGVVSNQDGLIAWLAGTRADIDLTGADTQWNSSGSVYLGGQAVLPGGSGELHVSNGAEMHVAGDLRIWHSYYADVSGGLLTASNLDLYGGMSVDPGTMEILGGNVNIIDSDAFIEGTIDIQGSALNITGGGQLYGTILGDGTTQVALHDTDSAWSTEAALYVGTATAGENRLALLTVGSGAVVDVQGVVALLTPGALALSGGSINAAEFDLGTADFQGFGALNGRVFGEGAVITATGQLIMGGAMHPLGFSHDGLLHVGANPVTLNSLGFARPGALTTIQPGGRLAAPNGLVLDNGDYLSGAGTVIAPIAAGFGSTIFVGEGELHIGDPTATDGFFSDGVLEIGPQSVRLYDANEAVLGSLTTLGFGDAAGSLAAEYGAVLEFGKNLVGHGVVDTPDDPTTPLINNGSIVGDAIGRPIELTGYVKGVGTMDNVTITGTDAPGFSTARVYRGNMSYSGTVEIEIGGLNPGSGYDQINHSGTAGLGGELRIELVTGFEPQVGQAFTIMTYASRTGEFATVVGRGDCGGSVFELEYGDTALSLNVVPALPGDGDVDGDVDLTDYSRFRTCVSGPGGMIPTDCACFDVDHNSSVDLRDFGLLQAAFTGE